MNYSDCFWCGGTGNGNWPTIRPKRVCTNCRGSGNAPEYQLIKRAFRNKGGRQIKELPFEAELQFSVDTADGEKSLMLRPKKVHRILENEE